MKYLTRQALIDRLREHLLSLTDDETSVCMVAARKGFFCTGFAQFTEVELRRKFDWIANRRPDASRAELEDVINKYKVARAAALDVPLSCDAQMMDRDTCLGWDGFDGKQLAAFHKDWLGDVVEVVGPDWDPRHAPATKKTSA